jgi:hypothetical protein
VLESSIACKLAVRLVAFWSYDRNHLDAHASSVKHQKNEAAWVANGEHLKKKYMYKALVGPGLEQFVEMVCKYLPSSRSCTDIYPWLLTGVRQEVDLE